MFHVKTMSKGDFEFAVRITDTMNWNLVEDDFEFMAKLEPEGCFVLLYNSEKIGIVTNVSFGKVAWLGNLVISEKYRRKGAGALLVEHSVNYLRRKNVKTVGLYAYIDKIPFYERLGFKYDSDFIVLKGKSFPSSDVAGIREAGKGDTQKIIKYDASCFGASRKNLLEPILLNPDNLCYIFVEDGMMVGYVAAKVYEGLAEIGPLICEEGRSDIGINLLKSTLNRLKNFEITMCIPQKESAILNMLLGHNFSENFRVARMFLGPSPVKNCIYIAESLERG